eukprot:269096_1
MPASLVCRYLNLFVITLITVHAYLDQTEIDTLNILYNSWNGDFWSHCKWNMSIINDITEGNVIPHHCGLYFGTHTTLNNYQYVHSLFFRDYPHNNITGTIPSQISNLKYLLQINPFYNELYGTIPSAICNMNNLLDFLIYGNNFNGAVPDCLFDMPNILAIALMDNPKLSLKSSNIVQLCNKINNDYFEWLQLADIIYYGSIPDCIGYNLTNMYLLHIANMNGSLTGTIPPSLNNLTHLVSLEMKHLYGIETNTETYLNLKRMPHLFWIKLDLSYFMIDVLDLCELQLFAIGLVHNDENHLIEFPNNCIFENNKLEEFSINGHGFIGTINELLCTQNETLLELAILNTKYVQIDISDCITQFHQICVVQIENNTQFYSLPTISFNSSYLFVVIIQNNKHLNGEINNLLTENSP